MSTGKLSVIIPACNEIYLGKTIDDIIGKAAGEIEIIAYLDGYWCNPPLKDYDNLKIIHTPTQTGMREAINKAIAISTGKYIMKCDAHCIFSEGFDETLKTNCEENWLAVPRRYDLDKDTWQHGKKRTDYMYLSVPLNKPENCADRFWDCGFHGVRWDEKNKDENLYANKEIDDLMSFQGSCWFMYRKYFDYIEGMDIKTHGWFAHEAQELGNKVWLSGGRVIRNKKCWYAHLHKGKEMGRGYYLSRYEVQKSACISIDLWMNNKWPKQIRDIKWLIDKFSPVPTWENYKW